VLRPWLTPADGARRAGARLRVGVAQRCRVRRRRGGVRDQMAQGVRGHGATQVDRGDRLHRWSAPLGGACRGDRGASRRRAWARGNLPPRHAERAGTLTMMRRRIADRSTRWWVALVVALVSASTLAQSFEWRDVTQVVSLQPDGRVVVIDTRTLW